MSRPPRLHVDGGFYHVILRGNHREPIFFATGDRERFADLVAEMIQQFRMRVHAYCWMTNHVHLLMQVSEVPLGHAIMRIAGRYARMVQERMPTTGHLFERRYRGILVDADEYLPELVRYIHLNPVRAGIVTAPQEYAYSGHQAYLRQAVTPWLTCEFTLRLFAPEPTAARRAYQRFVLAGIGARPNCELTVGRSDEPRVLGSDRFLESIKNARRPRDRTSLENLIVHVCREMGVHGADLRRPGRRRDLARVRAVIVHHASGAPDCYFERDCPPLRPQCLNALRVTPALPSDVP